MNNTIKINKRIVYISGAISGNPYFKLEFAIAEDFFLNQGHIVINPASLQFQFDESATDAERWAAFLIYDLNIFTKLNGILSVFTLPNAHRSKGSCLEQQAAREMGIPVTPILDVIPDYFEILKKERAKYEHD